MAQIPKISQQLQRSLSSKGYDGQLPYNVNKLPSFAIPRTTAYNLTTGVLAGLSIVGIIATRRQNLFYQGFAIALGVVVGLDYLQRIQIDKARVFSAKSRASFQQQLERHPEFKKAFHIIDAELDQKINQLQTIKSKISA